MAASSNLTVSISADSTRLRAELALAQAQIKQFSNELRVAAQAARQTGETTQVTAAAERYEQAAGRVRALGQEIRRLNQLRPLPPTERFNEFNQQLGNVGTAVAGLGGTLVNFRTLATISLAAIATAFFKLSTDAAKASDDLQDTAEAVGVSVDKILQFQLAAAREGADPEAAMQTLTRFSRAAGTALLAADKAVGVLGGSMVVLNGRADALGTSADVVRGSLGKLADAGKASADSLSAIGGSFDHTVNIVRGGVKPILDTTDSFTTLGIKIRDFPATQEGFLAAVEATSKRIDELGAGARRSSILAGLFGRNWARQVELFTNLKDRLAEAEKILNVMKLSPDAAEQQRTKDYLSSLAILTTVFNRIKTVTGTIVGQALVPLFKGLTDVLSTNQQQLMNWAQSAANFFIPIMEDVVTLLKEGFGGKFQTETVTQAVQVFKALAEIGNVVLGVFRGLISVLDLVAVAFNKIFGTEFTGTGLLILAIILKITGALRLLGVAVSATVSLFRLFGPIEGIFSRLAASGAWAFLLRILGPAGLLATGLLFLIDKFKLLGSMSLDAGNKTKETADKAATAVDIIRGATARASQTGERVITPERGTGAGTARLRPGEIPIGGAVREIPLAPGFDPSRGTATGVPQRVDRVTIDAGSVTLIQGGQTTTSGVPQQEQFGPPQPTALENLTAGTLQEIEKIKAIWAGFSDFVFGIMTTMRNTLTDGLNGISNIWADFISSLRNQMRNLPSAQGFAAGGFIQGPGTGTSDSILARLSNGEFVMRAAAVRRFGVDFMEGLNNFAAGGLVGMPQIRFATGGLVAASASSTGQPVHLHLGGQSFALSGSESVVHALVGAAHRQQMKSVGVKPSWVGGRPSGR
jgi:hypothetical protein